MKVLQKSTRFFRNEAIGTDYIFDFDIEVFVSLNGEIEDYSGCSFEKATKLIALNQ
jgi:hypothetical protein